MPEIQRTAQAASPSPSPQTAPLVETLSAILDIMLDGDDDVVGDDRVRGTC